MKYFLIAGEASGDLHASNLMSALARADGEARFRYMGGDKMSGISEGLVVHYRETSYMMLDVMLHLGKILRRMRLLKREISRWRPDVVILVDFPGFNLRMARYAKRLGLKVFYFIPPKVWAWKQGRVELLRRYSDRIFAIFPFERPFYRSLGIEVEYFGNPLVDEVERFRKGSGGSDAWKFSNGLDRRPVVALLPGSRRREIEALLPAMVKMAADHPGYQFVVGGAPSLEPSFYEPFLEGSGVRIVFGQTYLLLETAMAGVITSGTATLEAALFDVPQVVVYRTGPLAYFIGKLIIKINFISLVNLVLDRQLVGEIIQTDIYGRAGTVLNGILNDDCTRREIQEGYSELRAGLGEEGVSERIARRMVELVKEDNQ